MTSLDAYVMGGGGLDILKRSIDKLTKNGTRI